jgi:hypothetical protein
MLLMFYSQLEMPKLHGFAPLSQFYMIAVPFTTELRRLDIPTVNWHPGIYIYFCN